MEKEINLLQWDETNNRFFSWIVYWYKFDENVIRPAISKEIDELSYFFIIWYVENAFKWNIRLKSKFRIEENCFYLIDELLAITKMQTSGQLDFIKRL